MAARKVGAVLNVGGTDHPYFLSLVLEGVWGVSSKEFEGWVMVEPKTPVLLYMKHRGVWGLWAEAQLVEKFANPFPVSYWFRHPYSRPFQIRLKYVFPEKVDQESLDRVVPVGREELAGFGFKVDRGGRWVLRVFRGKRDFGVFEKILSEFRRRNSY